MKAGTTVVLVAGAVAAAIALSQCDKMGEAQSPNVTVTETVSAIGAYPQHPQCFRYPCFPQRTPLPRRHVGPAQSSLPRR